MVKMQDAIKNAQKKHPFKYVFYFPVDSQQLDVSWVENAIKVADYPVTYTEFAHKEVRKVDKEINLDIIYHGVDMKIFKPFQTEAEEGIFRREWFGEKVPYADYIITTVNRNQPRKDLPRTILAFKEFCAKFPKIPAKLYLHCNAYDKSGFKLIEFAKKHLPKNILDRIILPDPKQFGHRGYAIDIVSKIYAASDVVISTTKGEGWGLCCSESMACRTSVIMPDNTSARELVGAKEERGYLCKSGGDINLYSTMLYDNENVRPLVDINSLVKKLKWVYDNPEEASKKATLAYEWLKKYTWDKQAEKWDKLFIEAYKALNSKKK